MMHRQLQPCDGARQGYAVLNGGTVFTERDNAIPWRMLEFVYVLKW